MMREILNGLKSLANITKSVEDVEKKMDRVLDGMESMRGEINHVDRRVIRLEEIRDSIRADVRSYIMEDIAHMMIGMNDKLNGLEDRYAALHDEVERIARRTKRKKKRLV
jgi:archaellum component FlaC